jgi:hypothetical protein
MLMALQPERTERPTETRSVITLFAFVNTLLECAGMYQGVAEASWCCVSIPCICLALHDTSRHE